MACLQSGSLTNGQVLPTDLSGQTLTVYLGPAVTISGVQTAANVTQADIPASKVCLPHSSEHPHMALALNLVALLCQNSATVSLFS